MNNYTMENQLTIGIKGENAFMKYFSSSLGPIKSDNREVDFAITTGKLSGSCAELKTDAYRSDTNFFFEKHTVFKTGYVKPGGPFRALNHSASLFVYYYLNSNTFYFFSPAKLLNYITNYLSEYICPLKQVINPSGIYSEGYLFNRNLIEKSGCLLGKCVFSGYYPT